MWSMYADSHRGICIGFNLEKLYRSLKSKNRYNEIIMLIVKYSKELKPNCFFKDPFKAVIEWLRTKSIDWEYEKEIRIAFGPFVESKDKSGFVSFDLDSIEEIYFGCNMDENNRDTISDLLQAKSLKCKQYKMSLNDNKYKLEINKNSC